MPSFRVRFSLQPRLGSSVGRAEDWKSSCRGFNSLPSHFTFSQPTLYKKKSGIHPFYNRFLQQLPKYESNRKFSSTISARDNIASRTRQPSRSRFVRNNQQGYFNYKLTNKWMSLKVIHNSLKDFSKRSFVCDPDRCEKNCRQNNGRTNGSQS